ncbi:hypothetical protein MAH1_11590 [Sessilibacter sp. MAH1]
MLHLILPTNIVKKLSSHGLGVLTYVALCSPAFAQTDQSLALANDASSPAPAAQTRLIPRIENEIARIESEQGPFGASLSEQLQSLATRYQDQGLHEEALIALNRAIHVQRINGGLYDLSQALLIEQTISSHVALGDWNEASNRHDHLLWLHQRNFADDDPRMLPVFEKLSDWHLNAYSVNRSSVIGHLLNAYNLYNNSLALIQSNFGQNDLRLVDPLRGYALANYYFANLRFEQNDPAYRSQFNQPTSTAEFSTRDNRRSDREIELKLRIDQYIQSSYVQGKKAMLKIVDIYKHNDNVDPKEMFIAQVQLGDWYMLFNAPKAAAKEYEEALAMVDEKNDEELSNYAKSVFSHPTALPDQPLIETESYELNGESEFVMVKYDVTDNGNTRNIEVLDAQPENNIGLRINVKRNLRNAIFRPKYENGKAVDTTGIVHRFVVPNS